MSVGYALNNPLKGCSQLEVLGWWEQKKEEGLFSLHSRSTSRYREIWRDLTSVHAKNTTRNAPLALY